jgi:hypothetical protein
MGEDGEPHQESRLARDAGQGCRLGVQIMLYVLIFIVAFGLGLGCGISDLGSGHDEPDA